MAASALVATAGGEVSFDDRHKVDQILEKLAAFTAFNYHAALVHFEEFADDIRKNAEAGQARALRTVGIFAGKAKDSRVILHIACAVGQDEGDYAPAAVARIGEIAKALDQPVPRLADDAGTAGGLGSRSEAGKAVTIAVGNQKGGTGKSTTAVHLAVGLMSRGHRVGCLDLDGEQGTFSHYLANRRAHVEKAERDLPMPLCHRVEPSIAQEQEAAEAEDRDRLDQAFERFAGFDYLIVDTPGNQGRLSRLGHGNADILITPLNDSFLDIDVLAEIELDERRVVAPSAYAQMVMSQNRRRIEKGRRPIDWMVMRNRLAQLDTRNSRDMRRLLDQLAERMGFALLPGLSERMIFRELFYNGLTLFDLPEHDNEAHANASRWNARREIGRLVDAVAGLGAARATAEPAPDMAALMKHMEADGWTEPPAGEADEKSPEDGPDDTEAEDPFLMLKEAMSQSH